MYLAILLVIIGILSLASLVISGISIAYVYKLKTDMIIQSMQPQSLLSEDEEDEINKFFKNEDIEKINKKKEDEFEEEFMNPLKSRGL